MNPFTSCKIFEKFLTFTKAQFTHLLNGINSSYFIGRLTESTADTLCIKYVSINIYIFFDWKPSLKAQDLNIYHLSGVEVCLIYVRFRSVWKCINRACLRTDFIACDLFLPLDSVEIFHTFFFFLVYEITFSLTHIQFISRSYLGHIFLFLISLKESKNLGKSRSFREFNNQMITVMSKEKLEFQCSWKWGSLIQLRLLYLSIFLGHFFKRLQSIPICILFYVLFHVCIPRCLSFS